MIIDIFELTSKKIARQPIDLSFEMDKIYDGAEFVNFSKAITLNGNFSMAEDIIYLDAKLTTELILTCSRCLEKFNYPLEIEIHEKLSGNKDNDNEDVIIIDSDKLDIANIIENNIILALPMKRLCKKDCKGLCQVCGINLNQSTCGCKQEAVDPRLAKLKDLFSAD